MILNRETSGVLNTGFKAAFQRGFEGALLEWAKIATKVPSSTAAEQYGWLKSWPALREWIGDRQVKNIAEGKYTIVNKPFESTVGVPVPAIEDDSYGVYAPLMEAMGQEAREMPEKLVFELLAAAFTELCYDGKPFFAADHPVKQPDGSSAAVSNTGGGSGTPWYVLDTSRSLKPLIYQERKAPKFVAMDKVDDEGVFTSNEFRYGVDMRCNVGFGFWQMAYASKQTLNAANFQAAYAAMMAFKQDGSGKPLGVRPRLLVVGPSLRDKALEIVKTEKQAGGASNINFNVVDVLVSPYLT